MRSLVLFLFLLPSVVLAQAIQFKNLSIDNAFKKAKTENKDVFITVYTSYCEACNMMQEEIFEERKVGHYYNQHYISLLIDANSQEGKQLVDEYKLHDYPSFLFIGQDKQPLHLFVGNMSENEFMKSTKEAKDPNQQLYTLKKTINKNSSIQDLSEYIYVTYRASMEDPEILTAFLNKIEQDHIEIKKIWFALKEVTIHNGLHSKALTYVIKHAREIEKQYGTKEIIQTINGAAKVSMQPYVEKKDIKGWQELMTYLEKELGKQGETLNCAYNPTFYLNIEDYNTAYSKMLQGVDILKDRNQEIKAYLYRNWAWNIYYYYDESDKVKTGLDWINEAIKVHPTCMNLETKAGLLFKNKEYKEAKVLAEQAVELEKKENVHAMLAHTILQELESIE
ncbi:DUF255 domain-containing protein [Flammeovirga sp. EKP202]|uniref:thioredoxin family protein n=1 Tax=Flammeovirga sp. EKP202 TaxID=2770592 RepID=UPI00165EEFF9|nr:DUF255 domain-containing protein [Flammeovirga sp. EKP202]MBD0401213.1 DUF255 domain-containing protein [Flammeovirga sp. EKP202]